MGRGRVKLGWMVARKARQASEPTALPPAPPEDAERIHLRQRIENMCRKLNMMKITNRAREVFIVLATLLDGHHQILNGMPEDLAVDVMAVVQLRKKVLSDHIKLQMPPPAAASLNVPVGMDGAGETRRGNNFLEMVVATMADQNGGVQPTDADVERFLRELVFH